MTMTEARATETIEFTQDELDMCLEALYLHERRLGGEILPDLAAARLRVSSEAVGNAYDQGLTIESALSAEAPSLESDRALAAAALSKVNAALG